MVLKATISGSGRLWFHLAFFKAHTKVHNILLGMVIIEVYDQKDVASSLLEHLGAMLSQLSGRLCGVYG